MGTAKPNAKELFKRLLADEDGQATTEYVLLMVVLIATILTLGKAFRDKMINLVQGPLSSRIQNDFFNTNRIHTFRMNVN